MAHATFKMPPARDYGWALKPADASLFKMHKRPNGQICVVLNQPLLRGVTSEMIDWWFRSFPAMRVTLEDVPGYEGQTVPGYYLWHPSDHHSAKVSGGRGGNPRKGAKIHIREAMQYQTYGDEFGVDQALTIHDMGPGLWAMGKDVPVLGRVLSMRIRYADTLENGAGAGVHYHYEVVIGTSIGGVLGEGINQLVTRTFSEDLFKAWHLLNVQEVGCFENFLPALFAQRAEAADSDGDGGFRYAPSMAPALDASAPQSAAGPDLFRRRVNGFEGTRDPHAYAAEADLALH